MSAAPSVSVAQTLRNAAYETLRLDLTDDTLTITIARPKALNALSQQVMRELGEVVTHLSERLGHGDGSPDWSIRGVILTGDGERSFVAGGDITEMSRMTPADTRAYAGAAQRVTSQLETLPVPVIAAVNGFALGGGCELALACDLIFAVETASFGQPEVALGLIPGFGGTVRLQKLVGPALARDLIFTGRRISATEAHEIGLVARVLPTTDALLAEAGAFIDLVAKQSPVAVAASKRVIREVAPLGTDAGLAVELDAFAACFSTEDMREGTTAFIEKRAAAFTGT